MTSRPVELKVHRTDAGVPLPVYMSGGASGMDMHAHPESPMTLEPGGFAAIPTGIVISLPIGFEAQIRPRSGLAYRHGVTVLNAPGTIDSDYRGEIKVILVNHGPSPVEIRKGMRIAQLVVAPVARAVLVEVAHLDELESTERQDGGFGHTGV